MCNATQKKCMRINLHSWNSLGSSDSVCTYVHVCYMQAWTYNIARDVVVLRIFPVYTFDVHKCRIAVFEAETCPIQEKIVSEYDQEIPHHKLQTTLWHREEEPLNHHETPGRQIKQSIQLSLPHQDDCNTWTDTKQRTTKHRAITDSHNGLERTQSNVQQNIEQLQTPTMGVTINKKSITTEPPP